MSDTDKQQDPDSTEGTNVEESSVDEDAAYEETAEAEVAAVSDEVSADLPVGDESEAEPSSTDAAPDIRPATGRSVAWLALLVSAVAVAAVAYMLFIDWRGADDDANDAIASLERQLNDSRKQLGDLDALVAELVGRDSVSTADIDALRAQLEERVDLLSSLPPRMSTLESSVASLAGISEGARDTWLLAEAEYYMQIANAQLQLANNPHLASLALRMAD